MMSSAAGSGARHIADFDEPKLDLLEEALRFSSVARLAIETRDSSTPQKARDEATLPR